MLRLKDFARIYLHRDYIDFRKGINGLLIIVEEELELEPFEKYLFVFCNRRRDRMKILYWDKTGFALWLKRLERDKYHWPKKLTGDKIEVDVKQMQLLLDGYNLWKLKPHEQIKFKITY